ncbi:hypothetical protein PILCRDRAFT_815077, partial [Piloderma croceum F 1598]
MHFFHVYMREGTVVLFPDFWCRHFPPKGTYLQVGSEKSPFKDDSLKVKNVEGSSRGAFLNRLRSYWTVQLFPVASVI